MYALIKNKNQQYSFLTLSIKEQMIGVVDLVKELILTEDPEVMKWHIKTFASYVCVLDSDKDKDVIEFLFTEQIVAIITNLAGTNDIPVALHACVTLGQLFLHDNQFI